MLEGIGFGLLLEGREATFQRNAGIIQHPALSATSFHPRSVFFLFSLVFFGANNTK
jgi:hypothetical protein